MEMTLQTAMAIGQDAGNRSMRAAGRSAWNETDWDAACAAYEAAVGLTDVDRVALRLIRNEIVGSFNEQKPTQRVLS